MDEENDEWANGEYVACSYCHTLFAEEDYHRCSEMEWPYDDKDRCISNFLDLRS